MALTTAAALTPPATHARRVATVGRGETARLSVRSDSVALNLTVANVVRGWKNLVAGLGLAAVHSLGPSVR